MTIRGLTLERGLVKMFQVARQKDDLKDPWNLVTFKLNLDSVLRATLTCAPAILVAQPHALLPTK